MLTTAYSKTGLEFPAFFDGQENRLLGRIQTDAPKLQCRPFTDYLASINAPNIDLNKIPDYDRYQKNVPILDQDGFNSCCAHSHTTLIEKARDQAGYTYVPLSPGFLYAFINGGRDAGSDPADAITTLEQIGISLDSEVPDRFFTEREIPSSARQTAQRFRIPSLAVYKCANFAECVTADYLGFSVSFTINVGPNFSAGRDGVVGFWPGWANHCVAFGEALRTVNGERQARFRNSWGTQWAENGCAWITAKHIDQQLNPECFALMWTLVDPQDPSKLPIKLS